VSRIAYRSPVDSRFLVVSLGQGGSVAQNPAIVVAQNPAFGVV